VTTVHTCGPKKAMGFLVNCSPIFPPPPPRQPDPRENQTSPATNRRERETTRKSGAEGGEKELEYFVCCFGGGRIPPNHNKPGNYLKLKPPGKEISKNSHEARSGKGSNEGDRGPGGGVARQTSKTGTNKQRQKTRPSRSVPRREKKFPGKWLWVSTGTPCVGARGKVNTNWGGEDKGRKLKPAAKERFFARRGPYPTGNTIQKDTE